MFTLFTKRKNFSILSIIVAILLFAEPFSRYEETTLEATSAFLGPIYYGYTSVSAVFDHDAPIYGGDGNDNDYVIHNDGTEYTNTPGFQYDEHQGVDYSLTYKPVLGSADGIVKKAGWFNVSNHNDGLGLRVEIEHPNGYTTRYGHLNAVFVSSGETYVANPDKRESIIGISGNTGHSDNPHLYFELRNSENIVVNPYGWQSDTLDDPWEHHPDEIGATSYDLWEQYPAVFEHPELEELQYPTGSSVTAPPISDTPSIEIDDSDPILFTHHDCWMDAGQFHQTVVQFPPPSSSMRCYAKWSLDQDTASVAGDHDVYCSPLTRGHLSI